MFHNGDLGSKDEIAKNAFEVCNFNKSATLTHRDKSQVSKHLNCLLLKTLWV